MCCPSSGTGARGCQRSTEKSTGDATPRIDVPQPEGPAIPGVASPVDFSVNAWQPRGPVPECGQHTEEVLLELGYDWEKIGALKERGTIP